MYQNLLIVDDEYDILEWLRDMFQYEFGMEIGVYTAPSAMDALELLDQIKFDVVLTDVRMPEMDGITLFERIKSNWPRCKTVFLTGYRNFDDMYKVANHKDVRFILKGETDEVIKQAVKDALAELRLELERDKLSWLQQEEAERVRYWMQKDFLDGILSGETYTDETLRKNVERFEFPVRLWLPFLILLIRLDTAKEASAGSVERIEAVNLIIKENLPENIQTHMHILENRQAILLVQSASGRETEWLRIFTVVQGAIEYAQIIFKRNYHGCFSAVMSSEPVSIPEITEALLQARRIMVGYLGGEREVIAHVETLEKGVKEAACNTACKVPLLRSYLELNKRDSYFEILAQCCAELTKGSRHDARATELYYSISVSLLQFINENRMYEKLAFSTGLYKLTKADEHASWNEAAEYLFDISGTIFRLLGENETVLSDRALKRVCGYIDENLAGDLSLTRLADVGGFNASYLSRLFKQNYQINITDYIYHKRMELAKSLLTGTGRKIQDIGGRTGYPSAQSFTRAFRNYVGLSPAEYRELHRENQ